MSSRVAPSASAASKSEAENGRNADALFESRDVREIREVRARTEREAEEKDDELRALVGSSYRDAIASADAIAEMERASAELTTVVAETCETLRSLPEAIAEAESAAAPGPASASADEDAADLDPTYAAGSRVKFLVDTPEKIWGSLEERDRLGAARRFLAARDVLDALMDPNPPDTASASAEKTRDPSDPSSESDRAAPALPRDQLLRAFPLVRQQAPLLDSLRAQIARRARDALAAPDAAADAADAADALAAAVAAERLSGEDAATLFLDARRARVRAGLRAAVSFSSSDRRGDAKKRRRRAARQIRAAAKEAASAALFLCERVLGGEEEDQHSSSDERSAKEGRGPLDRAPDTKVPTVFDLLDESAAGGAREAASLAFRGVVRPAEEIRRWALRGRESALKARKPTRAFVQGAFEAWIAGLARDIDRFAEDPERGLFAGAETLADLAEMERRVTSEKEKPGDAAERARRVYGDRSTGPSDFVAEGWGAALSDADLDDKGGVGARDAAKALLAEASKRASAWDALAGAPAMRRARDVLRRRLAPANLEAEAGARGGGGDRGDEEPVATDAPDARGDDVSASETTWRGDGLGLAADVVELVGGGASNFFNSSSSPATSLSSGASGAKASAALAEVRRDALAFAGADEAKLATLEAHVHDACAAGTLGLAEALAKRVRRCEETRDDRLEDDRGNQDDRGNLVDDDLGTLDDLSETALRAALAANALASGGGADELAATLGPAAEWRARAEAAARRGRSRSRAFGARRSAVSSRNVNQGGGDHPTHSRHSSRVSECLSALRGVAEKGFAFWADATARRVAATLDAALRRDAASGALAAETAHGWAPVAEGALEGAEGAEGADASIRLPSLPSPRASRAARDAARAAAASGGHRLPPAARDALAAAVARRLAEMHAAFAEKADIDASAGERGVLQLVFDVEYLRRAFGGSDGRFATSSRVTSRVTAAANSASSFAEAEREAAARAFARARDALARRLDPIDWATYEAPLGDAARRAEARTATLLGALRDLLGQAREEEGRARSIAPEAAASAAVAVAPRFSYLPVSLPASLRSGVGGHFVDGSRDRAAAIDWTAAGWDRFGDETDAADAGTSDGGGNFLGKLGQGLGLGKASMAWGL